MAAEDGVRFMQEMMELSSQQQKEQLPPRAIQIVSHPFFGRVVLTAGPAQFGTDLSKSSTGVSGLAKLRGYKWSLKGPSVVFFFCKRGAHVSSSGSQMERRVLARRALRYVLLVSVFVLSVTSPLFRLVCAGAGLCHCSRALQRLQ